MKIHHPSEKTLVLIKPDGLMRGLAGEIIKRFEQRGLKIIALKLQKPPLSHIRKHYRTDDKQLLAMGNRTIETCKTYKVDVKKTMGTQDPGKIGKLVWQWNVDFLSSGPLVAMVVSGVNAVEVVRKIVGDTIPQNAAAGTIRGDFTVDSVILANANKRAMRNIIHASGDKREAQREITHWFRKGEIYSYTRADEKLMFE